MCWPKVAATFTFTCADVEPGMRTAAAAAAAAAAAVAWEASTKVSLLVRSLSLLDRGCCNSVYYSSTGGSSSTYVLQLLLLLLGALQQHEEVVGHTNRSDRVVGGAELCE